MKIRCTKNSITQHESWMVVGLFAAGAIWAAIQSLDGNEPPVEWLPDYMFLALMGSLIAAQASQGIRIDPAGIAVTYFRIPMRRIYWNQVSQVAIDTSQSRSTRQNALLFVLENAPAFTKDDKAYHYHRKNHSVSYLIVFPCAQTEEIAATLNRILERHEHIAPLEATCMIPRKGSVMK